MSTTSFALRAREQPASSLTFKLLVALLVIASISFLCFFTLFVLRRLRSRRIRSTLPLYSEAAPTYKSQSPNSPPTSTQPRFLRSLFPGQRKQPYPDPATVRIDPGPLPEIHIHHLEELDESGKPAPSKVVVVRVGEASVSLEEDLPPYSGGVVVGGSQARPALMDKNME